MKDRTRGKKGGFGGSIRMAACACIAFGLAALPAAGQDPPGGPAHWQTAADNTRGLPSEQTALTLSVVGTAAAVASFFSGGSLGYFALVPLFAGPSLGAMYGGCWGRALMWTGLRTVGTFVLIGIALGDAEIEDVAGAAYAWIGGMALSAIIEMATIGKAVRKHNERLLARRGLNVAVAPFALPKGAGIQLRLSF